ncbi:hypothetical protein GOBAR_AA03346 [Gossypium barbadense]|uniref:Uncharacterized protein n=1 Tax=Gossypium barbadense TaxID=3634 RepID=A0A2P5YNS1_GOSBA|nr:hypothetical protein GOBAR_AA03346 [Gossypium barbadense]
MVREVVVAMRCQGADKSYEEWWLRGWVFMSWRDIISNVLWVLLIGGLDEAVLRKLRLMADGEGDEVGKVEDVPVRDAPQEIGVGRGEGRRLRAARIISGRGRDKTSKAELDRSRIVEVCHDDLKTEGRAEFHCELKVCRLDHLKEEPLRFSGQEGSDRVSHLNLFKYGPVNAVAHT